MNQRPSRFTSAVLVIDIISTCVKIFSESFAPRGPVLDVGSYHPAEYEGIYDRRSFFPGSEYIGCDLREGPGVDRIEDAENLSFANDSTGAVLLLEILEHLKNPQKAVGEARRVLRDDGLLAVSVPFSYRLHGLPTDYWRFTVSGLYQLLESFPQKVVFAVGPKDKPGVVFAAARKKESEDFAAEQARFRSAIESASKLLRRKSALSAFQDRGRDFLGLILGRAQVSVSFFDPSQPGGYIFERADSSQ